MVFNVNVIVVMIETDVTDKWLKKRFELKVILAVILVGESL